LGQPFNKNFFQLRTELQDGKYLSRRVPITPNIRAVHGIGAAPMKNISRLGGDHNAHLARHGFEQWQNNLN
jgi:hypothetical protein